MIHIARCRFLLLLLLSCLAAWVGSLHAGGRPSEAPETAMLEGEGFRMQAAPADEREAGRAPARQRAVKTRGSSRVLRAVCPISIRPPASDAPPPFTLRKMVVRCLQTLKLNRLAHRLYYRHVHGFEAATRSTLRGVEMALSRARQLGTLGQRDYFEFGLFKGYTFWHAQKTAARLGADTMRFFGFDSFAGLPPVEGQDRTAQDDFYEGQYACSYESVSTSLDRAGVDWDRTTLVKGYFNESLTDSLRTEHGMRPVGIALIDCDLYSSTTDVLRFLDPLIRDNSILIFDDWNCFNADDSKGQRKALAEYLARRDGLAAEPIFSYGTWGQAFRMRAA